MATYLFRGYDRFNKVLYNNRELLQFIKSRIGDYDPFTDKKLIIDVSIGHKDKNKNLIFANDIISVPNTPLDKHLYLVDENMLCHKFKFQSLYRNGRMVYSSNRSPKLEDVLAKGSILVGNIHINKDLTGGVSL